MFVLGCILLLGMALAAGRLVAQSHRLKYRPNTDYCYPRVDGIRHALRLRENTLDLPPVSPSASLILQVRVRSSFLGRFFNPSIEFVGNGTSSRHTLERGAGGLRFLVLPQRVCQTVGRPPLLGMVLRHLSVSSSDLELVEVEQPHPTERLMVLGAHPDDAEIGCFGLSKRHLPGLMMVTLTAGERPQRYCSLAGDPESGHVLYGRSRCYDSIASGLWLGIPSDRAVNLGYFDGTLADMMRDGGPVRSSASGLTDPSIFRSVNTRPLRQVHEATWANLVADLSELLNEHRPDAVACPHPLVDNHPDHGYAYLALAEAVERSGVDPNVLLYVTHPHSSEVYPFGAGGEALSLPPIFETTPFTDRPISIGLTRAEMADKYVALDNMRDLREMAESVPSGAGVARKATHWLLHALFGFGDYSRNYYRRAVRSEELFFFVPGAQVQDLASQVREREGVRVNRAYIA